MPAATETPLRDVLAANADELYRLAYLLTGDRDRSVEAFANTLDLDQGNTAFGEFMSAWARKEAPGAADLALVGCPR